MLEPWNNLNILPPPVNMFLCRNELDIAALEHVCTSIIHVLSKQSPLHTESAICSRFLYKYDKKFRHDIGYRNLKKVNTALRKYLTLNLFKDIQNFSSALPSKNDDEIYLPTRQMLEYIIIRIMAFSKIMLRICVCSKQAAVFYLDRIKRGESHWMSLLPYALLSRLWSMCMVLLQHSCSWYSNLYPYLNKLQLKGLDFLPDNYILPTDLEQWLELKDIDNFGRFDWAQKKLITINNFLIDDDENDLLGNIFEYVNDSNEVDETEPEENKPLLRKHNQFNFIQASKVDQGEILSREAFKVLNQSKKILENPKIRYYDISDNIKSQKTQVDQPKEIYKLKKNQNNNPHGGCNRHSYEAITDANTLKNFINKEDGLRNNSDNKSLTSHLSFMQWQSLKNSLLKLCEAITNRKIERKFKKIWKEKCLDYL